MAHPTGAKTPFLPGRGADARVPPANNKAVERRIGSLEQVVADSEAILKPTLWHFKIGPDIISTLSVNGYNQYGLFTLPRGGAVLHCYAFCSEPVSVAGAPRGGMVLPTSVKFEVGSKATPNDLLVLKETFGIAQTWFAAADKGAMFAADARVTPAYSATQPTDIVLGVTTNVNGDLMTVVSGLLEIVFVTV